MISPRLAPQAGRFFPDGTVLNDTELMVIDAKTHDTSNFQRPNPGATLKGRSEAGELCG